MNQNPAVLLSIDLDPPVRADQTLSVAAARIVLARTGIDRVFLSAGELDLLRHEVAGFQVRRSGQFLFRIVNPNRQRVERHIADVALNSALHRAAVNAVRPVDKIQLIIRNAYASALRLVVAVQAEHTILPAIHDHFFIAFARYIQVGHEKTQAVVVNLSARGISHPIRFVFPACRANVKPRFLLSLRHSARILEPVFHLAVYSMIADENPLALAMHQRKTVIAFGRAAHLTVIFKFIIRPAVRCMLAHLPRRLGLKIWRIRARDAGRRDQRHDDRANP